MAAERSRLLYSASAIDPLVLRRTPSVLGRSEELLSEEPSGAESDDPEGAVRKRRGSGTYLRALDRLDDTIEIIEPRSELLEQVQDVPLETLRRTGRTRFCAQDQHVPYYKRVEPFRVGWQNTYKSYSIKGGHKARDVENVIIPAVRSGPLRGTLGEVSYSARHCLKFQLDAEALMHIVQDVRPHGAKEWAMHPLEQEFFDQYGRLGCWTAYNIPLDLFLGLFPRTFQVVGSLRKFVRPHHKSRDRIVDSGEDVMRRLALLKAPPGGAPALPRQGSTPALPRLKGVRAKATYLPGSRPGSKSPSGMTSEVKLPPI